ncbi:MAG: MFS transporter, partial [Chloroflexi bacterium]|nr:MFS transporter [Chloroflexota bacterium]
MKGEQQVGGTAGYLELFRRNRDFRLLFAAQVVSYCGDWFLTVALLDLVLRLTGSATLAGLLILCQTLPMFLCAPWAGTVVDRYDRRRLMIALDVGRIGLALLPIAAQSVELLPLAYVSVVGISVGAAFFAPAMQAAIPNVVTGEELGRVNVLMGSTWGTMLAVGSALGGIVAGLFGVAAACVFDAGTFAFSALALWAIRRPFQQQLSRSRVPLVASLREAAAYAREHPRVLALLTCKGGFGVGAGAAVLLSVFATTVFQS